MWEMSFMYEKRPQLMCALCLDMPGLYNQLFKILVVNAVLLAGREMGGGSIIKSNCNNY